MLVVFDYRCPVCGQKEERLVDKLTKDTQLCHKTHLGNQILFMTRLPAGTRTHFRFADKKLKR